MWIFTIDGYYSAVQDKENPARILVRSRKKIDLQTFFIRLERENLTILAWAGSDYAFRVFMPRELWNSYHNMAGHELHHFNSIKENYSQELDTGGIDTMTKEKYLTVRWNNLLALGLGLPTLIYVIVAFSTSIWLGREGMIGLAIIGALY